MKQALYFLIMVLIGYSYQAQASGSGFSKSVYIDPGLEKSLDIEILARGFVVIMLMGCITSESTWKDCVQSWNQLFTMLPDSDVKQTVMMILPGAIRQGKTDNEMSGYVQPDRAHYRSRPKQYHDRRTVLMRIQQPR